MAGIGRIYPLPTPGISLISLNYLVSYDKKNNTFLKGFTNLEGKVELAFTIFTNGLLFKIQNERFKSNNTAVL